MKLTLQAPGADWCMHQIVFQLKCPGFCNRQLKITIALLLYVALFQQIYEIKLGILLASEFHRLS